jgi:peptide/nickel transport system substrate-binding protein
MIRTRAVFLAAALALISVITFLATAPAWADNIVRWARSSGMPSWEPLANDSEPWNGLGQVYEALLLTDADASVQPGLATAWALVRPDTWRFELRQGVRFHDGSPFTAEDVVFSLIRARGETSELAHVAASIAGVTAISEHAVEITTKQPDPLLPAKLRVLLVLSKAWAKRHGAELPAQLGDTAAYTFAHANGTGPFMLESFEPGKRTTLVKNPHWWGLEQYPHNIDRVVWTSEPDPERRLALLLDGQIDLLNDPSDRFDRLHDVPGIRLPQARGLRVTFLGLDQTSAELRTSDVKGRNVFADRRVRQAVYQAIDVEALISRALDSLAEPAGMIAAPGVTGFDPELDRRLPYDLEGAKELLDAAGVQGGFAVRLDCRESYRQVCQEVAAQLAGIGIRVTVDALPFEAWKTRLSKRATDFYLGSEYAGFTLDSIEPFHDIFYNPPAWYGGATGYDNPAFEALLEQIEGEMIITYARDALIEQAWRMVLQDIVVIPLYRPQEVWAMRSTLQLPVSVLATPRFRQARVIKAVR